MAKPVIGLKSCPSDFAAEGGIINQQRTKRVNGHISAPKIKLSTRIVILSIVGLPNQHEALFIAILLVIVNKPVHKTPYGFCPTEWAIPNQFSCD